MKLIVFFVGDDSVGIFDQQYEVECPFCKEDVDEKDLIFFKDSIVGVYKEFDCNGAMYDFEINEMNKTYVQQTN